ncbi:hypothetical protein LNA01_26280 [Companilactobacillus nantensis]|nr:hypothetical protein LNA01_26280 [Companilactobacillus nantensis]
MHTGFVCDLQSYEKRKKLACVARFRAAAVIWSKKTQHIYKNQKPTNTIKKIPPKPTKVGVKGICRFFV